MHEAIKSYDELCREVLTMAIFRKAENHKQTQAPAAMDLNVVMDKVRASINGNYEPATAKANIQDFEGEKRKDTSELDQAVVDIMAMVRGQGKGREMREFYICVKTGFLAKDCWSKANGKGKDHGGKRGYAGKGDFRRVTAKEGKMEKARTKRRLLDMLRKSSRIRFADEKGC